ncbi:MAG: proton-conducting membrane transporter, partial [Clostridia bacterium]|nr:proton-conducting membrane transporter [Clostridia bacterium]
LTMAANYLTMYLCFEFMTLLSMPMVLQDGTPEAIAAARKYLFYSIFGATLGLLGMFFANLYGTTLAFQTGGVLDPARYAGKESVLLVVCFLSIAGFGAKAGLFPLHAWLPTAHPVAPAPASAVLSGVITKAGVLCIIRLLYQIWGPAFLRGTWVQYALIGLALVTVFMGSMMAYGEDLFKRRLAYSTVSQVSYVLTGLFMMNASGVLGGLLHAAYHSIIKDGLFMVAGAIIFTNHKEYVSQLRGMGKKMPVTYACFTLFSLGLIGIPPFAGFLSKWYLAEGSLNAGLPVVAWLAPAVLLLSALLTAGYLLPICISGFFPGEDAPEAEGKEAPRQMLLPIVILAAATVVFGVFAGLLADPLKIIAQNLL